MVGVTRGCARGRRRRSSLVCVSGAIDDAYEGLLTREGGSETGSNEKFSMRLAWQRDFWRIEDKLRSSSSA